MYCYVLAIYAIWGISDMSSHDQVHENTTNVGEIHSEVETSSPLSTTDQINNPTSWNIQRNNKKAQGINYITVYLIN